MIVDYCQVVSEYENGANWCCNLLHGHPGQHDNGIGDSWDAVSNVDGPDRLHVAAVNLAGSQRGIAELESALTEVLGPADAAQALHVIGDVLNRWRHGGTS